MYIRLARVYHMYINQTIYTHIKTLPYYVNRKLTSADSWLWNPSHDQGKKKKITSANTTKIIILTIWGNSYMMTVWLANWGQHWLVIWGQVSIDQLTR